MKISNNVSFPHDDSTFFLFKISLGKPPVCWNYMRKNFYFLTPWEEKSVVSHSLCWQYFFRAEIFQMLTFLQNINFVKQNNQREDRTGRGAKTVEITLFCDGSRPRSNTLYFPSLLPLRGSVCWLWLSCCLAILISPVWPGRVPLRCPAW